MAKRLRLARERRFRSATKAAEAMGMKVSTYLAHENGQNDFDPPAAERYARRFGVSAGWLLTGNDPDEEFHDAPATLGSQTGARGIPDDSIPQVDVTLGMGGGGLALVADGVSGAHGMTFAAEHVRDYWRMPPAVLAGLMLKPRDLAIVPVQGDSMHPTLTEGDFVFIDTRHHFPSPDGIYALADEFGGLVVKRLEVSSKADDEEISVRIISDNERHSPRERLLSEIHIIGRVVRKFTTVR